MDRNLLLSFMFTTMLLYTSNTLDNEMEGIDKTESIITDTTTTTESFEEFMLKYDLKENKSVNLTLFNFTDPNTTAFDEWFEVSDTAREEGRSIATLIPLIAQKYQSGIFFYLLSPQPDGSCFAGIDYRLNSANFSEYTGISIDLRRQAAHHMNRFLRPPVNDNK
uniref:NADH:ubiquinone oxidoreductase complex I intermediate-associated protein 30,domain-containing protein n=1 Tax=Schistosoma japonicum TaxID=6182 RepID=C1LJG8_SCHJA|nr:NADH:ubiquinone oxidoreductase complex I intermediate-associated protein 30,domain-containing protein [Schistosoma japonicum]